MTTEERDSRITTLEDDMSRLIRLVDGEGELAPGIVGILRRHEDIQKRQAARIEALELVLARAKWTFAGFAAAGGVFGGGLVFLFTKLMEGNLPT